MRNNGEGEAGDRIFIYNRSQGEVTWQWTFENHGFPRDGGGNFTEDWTHVNDVDKVGDGLFLLSPRNFDQVLVVNRTTKEIEFRLGEDGNYDIMKEQHNPDLLVGPDGRPTVLVADSENNRVVEYTRKDGEWERTWTLNGSLNWPRDADRLPKGNTLVVDSWNHRVVEVTPEGEVVWEAYTPWLVYDAERIGTGDGSNGPTIAEQGKAGNYTLHGGSGMHRNMSALEACAAHLRNSPRRTATPFPDGGPGTATGTGEWYYGTSVDGGDDDLGTLPLAAVGVVFALVFVGLLSFRFRA